MTLNFPNFPTMLSLFPISSLFSPQVPLLTPIRENLLSGGDTCCFATLIALVWSLLQKAEDWFLMASRGRCVSHDCHILSVGGTYNRHQNCVRARPSDKSPATLTLCHSLGHSIYIVWGCGPENCWNLHFLPPLPPPTNSILDSFQISEDRRTLARPPFPKNLLYSGTPPTLRKMSTLRSFSMELPLVQAQPCL